MRRIASSSAWACPMTRTDLPYTYFNRKRLADGRWRDYWRFRKDGIDTPLPGQPGEPKFHARYAELTGQAEREKADKTPARHTFEWLAKAYMASVEFGALAERTQDDYRKTIERRLVPIMGMERFDAISRAAVKAIRDKLAKTHSARTAHKIKQTVSCIYSWADGEELLPATFHNPAQGIRRLKAKQKAIEIWSPEEVALFLGAKVPRVTITAVMLALYTGQRREDLVQMVWQDVQGDMIRVRQNKTGEPLTIPMHSALKAHLAAIRTDFGGPILRDAKGRPMNAGQLSSAMNRAVAKVPAMPHRSLHGLRYAAAGELEAAGCSVVQISAIVGHRTYQMAMKYARQRSDAIAAAEKWERA